MKLTRSTKSFDIKSCEQKWLLINAEGKALGRLAARVSNILRGKHKPQFTPHTDSGDFVVVINAQKVKLSGKKSEEKKYYRHSGYIGGIKEITAGELLRNKPEELIRRAVKGMLPKTKLSDRIIKKLKVYRGESHPHEAQMPTVLEEIR